MRKVKGRVLPQARKEGIIVQEVTNELLIYDLDRHKAHCLNQTAALIWKHCDGHTPVEHAQRLIGESNAPSGEEIIWMAVSQLRKRHLLTDEIGVSRGRSGLARREMIRKIGIAAAAGLPLVTSVVAPKAIQAGSCSCPPGPLPVCCPGGCPCSISSQCCSGVCSGGRCS